MERTGAWYQEKKELDGVLGIGGYFNLLSTLLDGANLIRHLELRETNF